MKYTLLILSIIIISLTACNNKIIKSEPILNSDANVMPTEDKTSIVFEPIYFDFDSAKLNNEAIRALNRVILELSKEKTYIITGHCDEVGTDEYNDKLGLLRALTVQSYLNEHEITSLVQSNGKRNPISIIDKYNRRVIIKN